MPNGMQTLIDAIPTAQDGDPITTVYHNTLRAAVVKLATQPGAGGAQTVTYSFAPVFTQTAGGTGPWAQPLGYAAKPAPPTGSPLSSADGWFPVQLPDGMRIQSMIVTGQITGTVMFFQVQLERQAVTGTSNPPLIAIQVTTADGDPRSSPSGAFQVRRDGTPGNEQLIVNNGSYKYLVAAQLFNASADAIVNIYAVQVVCGTA